MSDQIEPCTTYNRRKRHYSASLVRLNAGTRVKGRAGLTLCGQGGIDEERATQHALALRGKRIRLADLPECRSCARSKQRREAGDDAS